MKKEKFKFLSVINWCLLFTLPVILLTVNVKTNTIDSTILTKKLSTNLFNKVIEVEAVLEKEEVVVEEVKDEKLEEVIKKDTEKIEEVNVIKREEVKKEEIKVEKPVEIPKEEVTDVIDTYTGKMSFYTASCRGCSGITSTGVDISDGKLYYNDKTYGNVRIIAAGSEIPKWSIVRLKNTSLGKDVLAIVLDRGGAIGLGKTFLIDMLTNSNENKGGVEKNIVVEVIRKGK